MLTLLRMILAFVIGAQILYSWGGSWWAFCLFAFASLTDFADGYVAEKTNARSLLGAALDPLADKILICVVFVCLLMAGVLAPVLVWAYIVTLVRDFVVLSLRSALGTRRLPVIGLAKGKTTLQFVAIGLALAPVGWCAQVAPVGIWLSAVLSVISGVIYLVKAWTSTDYTDHTGPFSHKPPQQTSSITVSAKHGGTTSGMTLTPTMKM